jgi:hypothetical protein
MKLEYADYTRVLKMDRRTQTAKIKWGAESDFNG